MFYRKFMRVFRSHSIKDKKGKPLKRFEYVIDANCSYFDPQFIASTAVDPYTSFALTESAEQLFPSIKSLVRYFLETLNNYLQF